MMRQMSRKRIADVRRFLAALEARRAARRRMNALNANSRTLLRKYVASQRNYMIEK